MLKSTVALKAGILRTGDKLGTLEVGKLADIVASDDNSLKNIKKLENVRFVMNEGVVYLNP